MPGAHGAPHRDSALVARDTIEEPILELHASKRALAEVILGRAGEAAALRAEDLLALIGDGRA